MTDTTTSYDTPNARRRAEAALAHTWTADPSPGWLWDRFAEAAALCARCSADSLLVGDDRLAREWASAHQLLRDRVERGHREIRTRLERRRERAA